MRYRGAVVRYVKAGARSHIEHAVANHPMKAAGPEPGRVEVEVEVYQASAVACVFLRDRRGGGMIGRR